MPDYVGGAITLEVVPGPKIPGYIIRKDAAVRLNSAWRWESLGELNEWQAHDRPEAL
jgi:hypothetical protein